jgi:exopolyphosphatase / guanosine-5'-triphosphate,3'-diphosphate pyrophosphatase
VQGLARRCNWDEAHARHVARLALELFDGTAELHGLGSDDREILEYAAFLHDIGEHVSPTGHHKHSAYLVRHGRLRGFDPEEIQLLAALARWHRRGEPKGGSEFSLVDEDRLRRLSALLRLADGLDRGRSGAVEGLIVRVGPSLVVVQLRARHNVELELWGARRKRELFERVFGRDLEIVTEPVAGIPGERLA